MGAIVIGVGLRYTPASKAEELDLWLWMSLSSSFSGYRMNGFDLFSLMECDCLEAPT